MDQEKEIETYVDAEEYDRGGRTSSIYSRKAGVKKIGTVNRGITGDQSSRNRGHIRDESTDSISSWKNTQIPNKIHNKKTTQDLINELSADIGSTYNSLNRSSMDPSNHIYQTEKKPNPSTSMTKHKVLNTAPQKPSYLTNNYLSNAQPVKEFNEDSNHSYFSRNRPLSPNTGSSFDPVFEERNQLSRAYSNSSLINYDRPMGYLERIANQKYQARGDSKGRGFDKYQRECKEDLELGRKAGEYLNKMPVQNGSVRLHRDYDSKFIS